MSKGREEGIYLAFENLPSRLIQIEIDNAQMVFHIRLIRGGNPVHVGRLNSRIQPLVVLGDPPVVRGLLVFGRLVPRIALGRFQSLFVRVVLVFDRLRVGCSLLEVQLDSGLVWVCERGGIQPLDGFFDRLPLQVGFPPVLWSLWRRVYVRNESLWRTEQEFYETYLVARDDQKKNSGHPPRYLPQFFAGQRAECRPS